MIENNIKIMELEIRKDSELAKWGVDRGYLEKQYFRIPVGSTVLGVYTNKDKNHKIFVEVNNFSGEDYTGLYVYLIKSDLKEINLISFEKLNYIGHIYENSHDTLWHVYAASIGVSFIGSPQPTK